MRRIEAVEFFCLLLLLLPLFQLLYVEELEGEAAECGRTSLISITIAQILDLFDGLIVSQVKVFSLLSHSSYN